MSDDTTLERAAKALYAASCLVDPLEPMQPEWGRNGYKTEVIYWQCLARAMLKELREPSHKMMEHGYDAIDAYAFHANQAKFTWQAMIDAALTD